MAQAKIRHDWFQNDDNVTVSIFIKAVKEEQFKLELTDRTVSVNVKLPNDSEVVFDLDPLCHAIDVSKSSYELLGSQIQIVLAKKEAGVQWSQIEGEEDSNITIAQTEHINHSYPTSSNKGSKNWDKITATEVTETEDQTSPDYFFKKLFKDADPNTQKAMMKSYQESGGTALSTNWNEVSREKTKIQPPDGMEARKYGE